MGHHIIAVTGIPGAWLNQVSKHLERNDGQILWPGQRQDMHSFQERYNDGENLELTRMHETILQQTGQGIYTTKAPAFWTIPYPGPEQYLNQFFKHPMMPGAGVTRRIILTDYKLCFFLPIWRAWVTDIIVCDYDLTESAQAIKRWTGAGNTGWAEEVAAHYSARLEKNIAGCQRLIRIPHKDILTGEYREVVNKQLGIQPNQ